MIRPAVDKITFKLKACLLINFPSNCLGAKFAFRIEEVLSPTKKEVSINKSQTEMNKHLLSDIGRIESITLTSVDQMVLISKLFDAIFNKNVPISIENEITRVKKARVFLIDINNLKKLLVAAA